jgi:hypothetical protein
MMVGMQMPQKAMHHKFVSTPSRKFHQQKSKQKRN